MKGSWAMVGVRIIRHLPEIITFLRIEANIICWRFLRFLLDADRNVDYGSLKVVIPDIFQVKIQNNSVKPILLLVCPKQKEIIGPALNMSVLT